MLPPPCGGFSRLSWGCVVLRGHEHTRLGWVLVPPSPYGVPTALRAFRGCTVPPAEAVGRPSMDLRSPAEFITGTPRRPAAQRPKAMTGMADDASSPGLSLPYGTVSGRWTRLRRQIPLPARTACGVWLPPARHPPPTLPTLSCRSAHGLHPSRRSPRSRSVPLSGP